MGDRGWRIKRRTNTGHAAFRKPCTWMLKGGDSRAVGALGRRQQETKAQVKRRYQLQLPAEAVGFGTPPTHMPLTKTTPAALGRTRMLRPRLTLAISFLSNSCRKPIQHPTPVKRYEQGA